MNQRPPGYEPDELPDCSTSRYYMAEELGFEPRRRFPDLPVFKTGPLSRLGIPPDIDGGPYRTRTYDQSVMSRPL